jgi:hypothetical protein
MDRVSGESSSALGVVNFNGFYLSVSRYGKTVTEHVTSPDVRTLIN